VSWTFYRAYIPTISPSLAYACFLVVACPVCAVGRSPHTLVRPPSNAKSPGKILFDKAVTLPSPSGPQTVKRAPDTLNQQRFWQLTYDLQNRLNTSAAAAAAATTTVNITSTPPTPDPTFPPPAPPKADIARLSTVHNVHSIHPHIHLRTLHSVNRHMRTSTIFDRQMRRLQRKGGRSRIRMR
jgi:hypothetical protein